LQYFPERDQQRRPKAPICKKASAVQYIKKLSGEGMNHDVTTLSLGLSHV